MQSRRFRLALIAIATPTLLLSAGLPSTAASTDGPTAALASAAAPTELVDDNGYDVGEVLARGTVVAANGDPVAGAQIEVLALAGQDVRAGLKIGESFELTPVAYATTRADGTYALEFDYAALDKVIQINEDARRTNLKSRVPGTSRTPRTDEQKVDLDIYVTSADGTLSRDYGATVSHVPGTRRARVGTLAPAVGVSTPSRSDAKAALLRSLDSPPALSFTLGAAKGTATGASVDVMSKYSIPKTCTLRQNYSPQVVYTGQTSATVTGGYVQKWTQTIGSSSSISEALSVSGTYGSWNKGRTVTAETTSETTWPSSSSSGARLMTTKYNFGKYYCIVVGTVARQEYRVLPQGHFGGTGTVSTTVPSAPYCAEYLPGSSWSKSTSNAITYTNGVQLKKTIGLDLSARTGFASSAKYSVTFSQKRNLCGVAGGPGSSAAYQLVVKP